MTLDDKLDELISLVRVLDTKINFIEEDISNIKEDIMQMKLSMEMLEEQSVTENSNWKVEKL